MVEKFKQPESESDDFAVKFQKVLDDFNRQSLEMIDIESEVRQPALLLYKGYQQARENGGLEEVLYQQAEDFIFQAARNAIKKLIRFKQNLN